jgi:hypothetical protein
MFGLLDKLQDDHATGSRYRPKIDPDGTGTKVRVARLGSASSI